MKSTIKYILVLMAAPFVFSSCLDMDPISETGESSFYKNESDLYQALIACYNGLQAPMNNEWQLTELRSDNSRIYSSGTDATTSKNIRALDIYQLDTSHPTVEAYWKDVYHNIANCNAVLKHSGVIENDSIKRLFEAEAKFIRAYHYFNLVRLFGPVFLVKERISGDEAELMIRSSIEETYQFIEDDLRVASTDLPVAHLASDKGRVDRWAAKTLLAKVYLTRGKLGEAKPLLLEVEDSSKSGYRLLPGSETNYGSIFSITNEMNQEIIFAVRYKAGNLGLGSSFANDFAPASSQSAVINGSGSGYNCPTDELRANFDADKDKRRDVCLADYWINSSETKVYMAYAKKYLSSVETKNDAENDWPVLRYADVVLMLAEIENEQSGPDAGLERLNKIRTRAGLTALLSQDVTDKNKFRKALANERRYEFAFENHRFFDLVRTNQLIPVMKNHFETETEPNQNTGETTLLYRGLESKATYINNPTLEEWQILLPIPYSVMTVMPNATQNPGY